MTMQQTPRKHRCIYKVGHTFSTAGYRPPKTGRSKKMYTTRAYGRDVNLIWKLVTG